MINHSDLDKRFTLARAIDCSLDHAENALSSLNQGNMKEATKNLSEVLEQLKLAEQLKRDLNLDPYNL